MPKKLTYKIIVHLSYFSAFVFPNRFFTTSTKVSHSKQSLSTTRALKIAFVKTQNVENECSKPKLILKGEKMIFSRSTIFWIMTFFSPIVSLVSRGQNMHCELQSDK